MAYAASFNRERIGFRSKWIAAVFYLQRRTYEIWLLGKCWTNTKGRVENVSLATMIKR